MEIFKDSVKDFINKLNGIDERKINRAILKIKNSKSNQKEYLELLVKKVASFLNENKNDSDRDLFIQKFKLALSLGDFKFSKEEVDELFKRYFSNEVTVSNIVKNVKAENNSSNDFSSKLNLSDIQNLKYDSLILSKINADLAVLRKYRNDMSYKRDKKYSKNDIPNEVKALLSDNVSGNGMKEVNAKIEELENYKKNTLTAINSNENTYSVVNTINDKILDFTKGIDSISKASTENLKEETNVEISSSNENANSVVDTNNTNVKDVSLGNYKVAISSQNDLKLSEVFDNGDSYRIKNLSEYGFERIIAEINDRLKVLRSFTEKNEYSGKTFSELIKLLNKFNQLDKQNITKLDGVNIQEEIEKINIELNKRKYCYENFSAEQINAEVERLINEKQKYIELNNQNNLNTYDMIIDNKFEGNKDKTGTVAKDDSDTSLFGNDLTTELFEEKVENESLTVVEDLKEKIDKLDDLSDVAIHLKINEILKIKSDEDKDILFDFLVEKVSKLIKKLDDEEQRNKANILKNLLSKYATLSDSKIGELFTKHGLDFGEKDNVKSDNIVVEEREIDKIERRIGELVRYFIEVPNYDVDLVKYIDKLKNDNKKLDLEKSAAIQKINGEIEALKLKFNQNTNEQLSEEERVIIDKYKHLSDEELLVELTNIDDDIKAIEKELQALNQSDDNIHSSTTNEEIEKQLESKKKELDEYQKELEAKGVLYTDLYMDEKLNKLNDEVNSLEDALKNSQSRQSDNNFVNTQEIEKELESKKKERDEYQKELEAKGVSYTDWYMDEKLNKLNDEVNSLEDALKDSQSIQSDNNFNYIVDKKRVELKKLLEEKKQKNIEINKEINRRRNSSSNGLIDNEDYRLALEELEKKKKQIQSECDTKTAENQKNIDKAEELKGLREIRDAYLTIRSDAIKNFETYNLNEKDASAIVKDFVDKHKLISELDNYAKITKLNPKLDPDVDKLRVELIEDVCNNLKLKKIKKVEKNNKLALKALSGIAGFVAGFAFHTSPIAGAIFGVRFAVGITKFVTNNFKDSKVTKVINGIGDKSKEFGKKHPNIANCVSKGIKVLKSDYFKWAFNGFTLGYMAGHIYDLFDKTNLDFGNDTNLGNNSDLGNNSNLGNNINLGNEPIDISVHKGDILDVSGIKEGFVSSTADNSVSLMTELGESVRVDQIVTVNGEKMVHLISEIDGEGYAWIPENAIKEVLEKAAKIVGKSR